MIVIIIFLILIVVPILVIAVIAFRHFPQMAAIDLSTITTEKHEEVKMRILITRLDRFLQGISIKMKIILKPFFLFLINIWNKFYDNLLKLERKYAYHDAAKLSAEKIEQKVLLLIHEAEEAEKSNDYASAENKLIEAINLDKTNIKIYEDLGNLYLLSKKHKEAEETFDFILKVNQDDASVNASMGELFLAESLPKKAWKYFKKAVTLKPGNPKYLDYFIETSIMIGNVEAANKGYAKLSESNPDNLKLVDFRQKIDELEKKLAEENRKMPT